jgi:exosortase
MSLRNKTIAFGIFCVGLLATSAPALRGLYELALKDESVSHTVLVPVVTLALIYQNRRFVFSSVRTEWVAGGAVFMAGALLSLWSTTVTTSIAGFTISLLGGFLLCYGREAFRQALFPLLFLGFMVPIPQVMLHAAVQVLKSGSTEMVAGLFTLTGTPYHRDGFIFSLPAVTIEVADECSGIRSSIALLITGTLASYTFLSRAWSRAILLLVIVPIAIFKNAVRIVTLTLLATHVDPSFLTGGLHSDGGIVFFLLSLALLAPILGLLRRSEGRFRPEFLYRKFHDNAIDPVS